MDDLVQWLRDQIVADEQTAHADEGNRPPRLPRRVAAMTPIKRGTAARLGLRPPRPTRRRKRGRGRTPAGYGSIMPAGGLHLNLRPPEPEIRYVVVPVERGMLR